MGMWLLLLLPSQLQILMKRVVKKVVTVVVVVVMVIMVVGGVKTQGPEGRVGRSRCLWNYWTWMTMTGERDNESRKKDEL